MAIALRTAVFWRALSLVSGKPIMQQPPERIRASSDRRRALTRLPLAWLVLGRRPRGVRVEDQVVTIPAGATRAHDVSTDLPIRVYRPSDDADAPRAVVVNFHGGGFVSGDVHQSEWWCGSIAASADVVVVSVEYRLAPEHKFPVPVEDCYAVTAWVAEHAAELEVDLTRLAVMGDSAGGNLAAAVSLMARDRGGPDIALQLLIYPVVELLDTFASEDENAHAPILGKADLTAAHGLYCASEDDAKSPYASPLRADSHADIAPALIQTAQHDPLRDQGPAYADALRRAGVAVRLTNYVDAVHGYISLPGVVPAAGQALSEAVAEIRSVLG
jgi:acetyl esterase